MSNQDNQLKIDNIIQEVDGCIGSFFSGYDGIVIFKSEKIGQSSLNSDYVAANFVSVIKNLSFEENKLSDIVVSFDKNIIAIRVMEDGFIGVIMTQDANIGRAKLELRKLGGRFL
jgi:predicted regulator of Ras-like GTPase activity (Roadblock/LC7/MglB family)